LILEWMYLEMFNLGYPTPYFLTKYTHTKRIGIYI